MSIILCSTESKNIYKTLQESYKTNRDFQIYSMQIINKLDFKDYCIARLGTENIEDLDMSNETKISVIKDYLKGITEMKKLAKINKIAINREPLYGKFAKNNQNIHDFSNFSNYL